MQQIVPSSSAISSTYLLSSLSAVSPSSSRSTEAASDSTDTTSNYMLSVPSGRTNAELLPDAAAAAASRKPSSQHKPNNEPGEPCSVFKIPESELAGWLRQEQTKGNFRFVQCGGKKRRVHSWYRKYVCHCYGQPEVKSTIKKEPNGSSDKSDGRTGDGRVRKSSRRSKKVGCPCVAYVTCDASGIALVRYYSTHRGHTMAKAEGRRDSLAALKTTRVSRARSRSLGSYLASRPAATSTSGAATATAALAAAPCSIPAPASYNLAPCASVDSESIVDLPLSAPSLPTAPQLQQQQPLLQAMTLAPSPTASPQPHVPLITTTAAVDPTTPAAGGLIESVSLWKTLGYMSFNETAPFSFGFVRPQALTHIHPSVHGHTKPLVLALERTLGTNVSGYPLYTLVIRGGQAGAAAEHLGYLITADMSHDAVQRWLAFLQRNLNLHPHTLLLDPEDIVGHAAASLVFGHSCILLWAIDRLESRWSHEALPLIAHSASALGYSGGRSVADVVMALLAPSAEGYQQPSTMQIHASSSAPLLAAHDAAHSPMSLCFHSTSPFLAPVPAPPIAAQSPPPASAAHGDAALAKANALFHATCNA